MEITPLRRCRGSRTAVQVLCTVVTLIGLALVIPAAFGLQRSVIAGQSMTGTYDRGSVVYSEVVHVADLEVSDVITYLPPVSSGIDDLVTHRITSIRATSSAPRAMRTPAPTRGPSSPPGPASGASRSASRTPGSSSRRCRVPPPGWP